MSNITIVKGNIFNTRAQTVVNTVNCVGVMGKGIALVYKLRYPLMFALYQEHCKQRLIDIGKLWLYKGDETDPWVLNFPTKRHWKYPSKLDYLEQGLKKFVETYTERGITSVAFPLLGTHNGGLDREVVLNLMKEYLSRCDIPIEIYEYDPTAPDDLFERFKQQWERMAENKKKTLTGLRSITQIQAINNALQDSTIKSMIALIDYPGVGLKTMECCFKVVMRQPWSSSLFENEEPTP